MGLPVNYYDGRHDPDHTVWLDYFVRTMAEAAETIRKRAESIHPLEARAAPWENLRRIQQQLLHNLLIRGLAGSPAPWWVFTVADVTKWYGISTNTAREWLTAWREIGFVQPAKAHTQRIRTYILAARWANLIKKAQLKATVKTT